MGRVKAFSSPQLAEQLAGRHEGDSVVVTRLCPPGSPRADGVVVLDGPAALGELADRAVGLIVAPQGMQLDGAATAVFVADTRQAFAELSRLFDTRPAPADGVSSHAHIDATAELGEGVSVAPGAVIGPRARLGPFVTVGPNCIIGPDVAIGEGTLLYGGVTLYDGVQLGSRVIVHSGAVIGADGFGYAVGPKSAAKIHQLGSVVVGDEVEIGANTAVDRGTLNDTSIGARTKIDNLCQIGHNVVIGEDCIIAGMAGIAGSTTLGRRVTVAGGARITDHVRIGDGAIIAGGAGVTKNVPPGQTWFGLPAEPYRDWVRTRHLLGKLERLWRLMKTQETS